MASHVKIFWNFKECILDISWKSHGNWLGWIHRHDVSPIADQVYAYTYCTVLASDIYSTELNLAFSALTLLVGRQEGHPACKKIEWWGAGVVICLELGADLHMAQLMPLPLTVSCFSKIQIGFAFLVPAHPGSPGKRAVKRVCVCVCVCVCVT